MADKTRLQKRAYEFSGGNYDAEMPCITDICLAIHGHITGASDPMPEETYLRHVACLEMCCDTWEDGAQQYCRFDEAVYRLVIATIEEHKRYYHGKS